MDKVKLSSTLGLIPLDLAMLDVKASALAGVPVLIEAGGAQQVHAVVAPTVPAPVGVEETGVHTMRAGEPAPLLQCGVEPGGRCSVGDRAGGGFDGRAQVRPIILTGFREVYWIAHPRRGGLAGIVGFRIIGRADEPCRWGDVIRLAPLELGAVPPLILAPDPAQEGARGHLALPGRGLWVIDGGQYPPAIRPNGQR